MQNSDIFHISPQNIDCWNSLEPPQWSSSNKCPQSMFLNRNKKNNVYPCKPQFYYIKGGQNYIGMFSWCSVSFRDVTESSMLTFGVSRSVCTSIDQSFGFPLAELLVLVECICVRPREVTIIRVQLCRLICNFCCLYIWPFLFCTLQTTDFWYLNDSFFFFFFFFFFFCRKLGLTLDVNCLQYLFSWKNKQKYFKISSANI